MGEIIDIRSIKDCDKNKVFAIDTNVLLWTFYSPGSKFPSYRKASYPDFISNLIQNGNRLIIHTMNLNEMCHVIEENEWKLYNKNVCEIHKKKFRSITEERIKVKEKLQLILKQIKSIPNVEIVESTIDCKMLDEFVDYYNLHKSDFFDFSLVSSCDNGIWAIITDDGDFKTPFCKPDIYTANRDMLCKNK